MKLYRAMQQKYIESVDGQAHASALKIIDLLERTVMAQSSLLTAYRVGGRAPEKALDILELARKNGVKF